MSATERAQRLQIETRDAIFRNIHALQRQRKVAIQAGDAAGVETLQDAIDTLHDQIDDLSFCSLQDLENSPALRRTIGDLQKAAKKLHDEADNIKTVAEGLSKAAEIIDLGAQILVKLRAFAPIP